MEGGIKAWSTSASTESWLEGSKLQCDMDVAPKALLKVVRCLTVRWDVTFRAVPGLECSTGCGECRGICANMYENITEDNEYEEDT